MLWKYFFLRVSCTITELQIGRYKGKVIIDMLNYCLYSADPTIIAANFNLLWFSVI